VNKLVDCSLTNSSHNGSTAPGICHHKTSKLRAIEKFKISNYLNNSMEQSPSED